MKWSTEEIRAIITKEGEADPIRVRFLLKRRNSPPEFLSKYADDDYAMELWNNKKQAERAKAIARTHKNLPREDIRGFIEWGMANYGTLDKIKVFLQNPVILTSDIEDLINNTSNEYEKEKVIRLTVRNPRFPVSLYEYCARHESPYVRSNLAHNVAIPKSIVEIILMDNNQIVLTALVFNPAAKEEIIIKLLEPERHPELFSPYLLTALVARLSDGEEFDKALVLLSEIKDDPSTKQLIGSISRDLDVLTKLCLDENPKVREMAMKNPLTPREARITGALLGTPMEISKNRELYPKRRNKARLKALKQGETK